MNNNNKSKSKKWLMFRFFVFKTMSWDNSRLKNLKNCKGIGKHPCQKVLILKFLHFYLQVSH